MAVRVLVTASVAATVMAAKSKRRHVAVIGAGPAGLAAGRYLAECGELPVIFESGSEVGGIWAGKPTNDVVYRSLVTNIPTVCMQSFDLDFQSGLRSYIQASELGSYYVQYAQHFQLQEFIRFGCQITRVRRCEATDAESAWEVSWTEGVESKSEGYDAVIVASGHYNTPYCPGLPGQAEWLAAASGRRVVHSIRYDDPAEFSGKAVLIVGGRSSGVDIARELRSHCSWLYVMDSSCNQIHSVDTCVNLPVGATLRPDGSLHLDGEAVPGPPVDVVLLATGYTYTFPFLDEQDLGLTFGPVRRYVAPLYQHILHTQHPSLCFIGIPLAVPCPIALFEAQAMLAVKHLQEPWTTDADREAWLSERFRKVGERSQDLHFLGGAAWQYMLDIVQEAGMAKEDFELYSRRLAVIRAVHEDRGKKRPEHPWGDDWYRRCEYSVDYESDSFQVTLPPDAAAQNSPDRKSVV